MQPPNHTLSLMRNPSYRNHKLEEQIRTCDSFSRVDVSRQHLKDQDMSIVSREAMIKKQCTKLYVWGNEITFQSVLILANALHNNTELQELGLSFNRLSDMGLHSLSLAVSNSTLKWLGLGESHITNVGVQYLAEMLKINRTLTRLYLSCNKIGDLGAQQLANALAYFNTTLEFLSLDSNPLITTSSVASFVDMLQHNRSLKTFWIFGCNISNEGKMRLRCAAHKVTLLV